MPVSRAEIADNHPDEWKVGAKVARFARRRTADRVAEMIVEADLTGSRDYLALRLRNLAEAEKTSDPLLIHDALMELAAAAAAGAIDLQLRTPIFASQLKAAMKGKNGNGASATA